MKSNNYIVLLLVVLGLSASALQAQSPLVSIDLVAVGDAGNAADQDYFGNGQIGSVPYEFSIGKYEVTLGQYAAFLNSVAAVPEDVYVAGLWNPSMATDLNVAGISRSGDGTLESPYVYAVIGNSNRPIAYVNWFDAARMANWMHNGATNGASTETGAYTLNGVTGGAIPRNPGAAWWIPTGDEWHKAAYYKGGNLNAGYWLYPAQSDNPPGNVIGGSPNQANILIADVYAITQSSSLSSSQNYLTEVGAFTASASAYGTYDQGGNLDEWTGDTNDRSVRGGSWNGDVVYSGSNSSDPLPPELEIPFVGFRLASNMTQSNPDSNGDGIPDAWFAQFPGLSETNEASSTVPGGGATFLEAYIYDVNPTNLPPDFNRVTKPGVAGAIFNFTITHTSVNRQYNVYWASALGSPDVWTNTVGAYKTGNGSSLGFTVTNTAPGLFYRTGARLPE